MAATVITASRRAAADHARPRAGMVCATSRHRSNVCTETPTSRETSPISALSGGNNLATTRFLNASPYLAISHPCRPQVQHHKEATTILTRGERQPDTEGFLHWAAYLKKTGDISGLVSALVGSLLRQPPDHLAYDRPALVFLHAEKTAGTSLQNMLIRSYGETAVYHEHADTLYCRSPRELAPYSVFAGHFNHDTLRYMPRSKKLLLTVVREPKARLQSLYNFLRAHEPESPSWDSGMELANQLDIMEFLEHPKIHEQTGCWNHMTCVVMGGQTWMEWKSTLAALTTSPDGNARASFLKKAGMAIQKRLSEFLWVGIQEEYDASIRLLFTTLERPHPEEVPVDHLRASLMAQHPFFKKEMPVQRISEISPCVAELMELDLSRKSLQQLDL
jgi:hypothetical protein